MGSERQIKGLSVVEAEDEEEAFMYSMNLATASLLPMALKTVIELDLIEMIAKAGPGACVSPSELAAQLPTKNPNAADMLDRLLRILASYSILSCTLRELPNGGVERLYGLRPVCKFLINDVDGDSMAPLVLLTQHKIHIEEWYYMKDAILEEGTLAFAKAHGMNHYEYIGQDPILRENFSRAMTGLSTIVTKKILQTYTGFDGLSLLVDVGGSAGSTLNLIISKYPNIKGINFDLPNVVQDAPIYPGVQHVGGDMFVNVPEGDGIMLKHVCHNWSDEHCIKILKNCYEALSDGGKLIIVDFILPLATDTKLSTRNVIQVDLSMLSHSGGGKERTEKEFESLTKESGFVGFQVACCTANTWVMECFKKS